MTDRDKCAMPGAVIERGTITEAAADGYRVEDLDRPGVTSRVITGTDDTAYTEGDTVYFFLFRDGTGKIICKV